MKHKFTGYQNFSYQEEDTEENDNIWQLSFLDTLTVLLCMMIVMVSVESKSLFEDTEAHANLDSEMEKGIPLMVSWDINDLDKELRQILGEELSQGKLFLESGEYEVRMQFSGSTFFNQGDADLLPEGKQIITRIINKLSAWKRQDYKIDIEGHTDSAPINSIKFPSNWELSSARAAGVVKFFLELGAPAQQLKASGYADAFPLKPERDSEGRFIAANQDYNRRIVLRLYFD